MIELTTTEELVLEVIDTGPATYQDVVRYGTPLIEESLTADQLGPGEARDSLDHIRVLGYIGRTGTQPLIVLSNAAREMLSTRRA